MSLIRDAIYVAKEIFSYRCLCYYTIILSTDCATHTFVFDRTGSCSMADLVFVLDSSGSMTNESWRKVLNFTVGIVNGIGIGQYDSHVGVVYYGSMAHLGFHLIEHENRADLIDAIMGKGIVRNVSLNIVSRIGPRCE